MTIVGAELRATITWFKRAVLAVRWALLSLPAWAASRLAGGKRDIVINRKTFDAQWYLINNPDVAEYQGDPFDHFLDHGAYEGRPGRFFDSYWYRRVNPDLRYTYMDTWAHYQRFGRDEGRRGRYFYVNGLGNRGDEEIKRSFDEWAVTYDTLDVTTVQNIHGAIKTFALNRPFDIVMRVDAAADIYAVERSLVAIRDQIYSHLNCIVVVPDDSPDAIVKVIRRVIGQDARFRSLGLSGHLGESAGFNLAAKETSSAFICFLTTRDILDPTALFWVAFNCLENGNAAIIYADEDRIGKSDKRADPYFKSEFNYELFLSHNMLGDFVVYRRDVFDRVRGFDELFTGDVSYDLAARAFDAFGDAGICHVPRLLNHLYDQALPVPYDIAVIERHLERRGRRGTVMPNAEAEGYGRVRFDLPKTRPLVSIVIPTRDRLELLRVAVNSVLEKTTYAPFEIIIVDNGSVEGPTLDYFDTLRDPRVRVLRDDRPFNFSALNNAAVGVAAGDYICLMNNDIEILTPDWLEEMMSFAVQPDVGCVGARLWYPNGTLQHGGVLVGFHGVAGHMHKFLPRGDSGYANRAVLHQSLSAVTAAVLLVKKSIYQAIGGLDESLAVSFNDVDFCLKVRDAGYRNVYTPFAEMNHYESASRGAEDSPEKKARETSEITIIKSRYGDSLMRDPAYSPNLSLLREDLSFAFPPRVKSIAEILIEARSTERKHSVSESQSVR